jgi:transcriptional regulator with XRE-family HTH domain
MEVLMKFHTRLKQLRLDHNLTQSDLADILGLKPTAISNYESQRNEPSLEKLILLSEYFDVSCDYLLGVTDSYLPVGGEVLDKDIVEVFDMYQQLDREHVEELKKFTQYLLYKQNLSI